jgi:mono/diheme cytochrome c family protein
MTSKEPGNFVAFDVVNRKVLWRKVSPAPFWAGAVATSSGLVFTGDMRGYFMAIDARTGTELWKFQTGSGIIGSPITYELDGTQYVVVPSGGIGGDMAFYYTEPKAGNIWVFALDGGGPAREPEGTNLTFLEGGVPMVGNPGHTLGGRVLPGYGFKPTEGGQPIKTAAPVWGAEGSVASPFLGQADAIAAGQATYRSRCVSCHKGGAGAGPQIFKSKLDPKRFADTVTSGREGTAMTAFGTLLSRDEIWQVHAYLMSRDGL